MKKIFSLLLLTLTLLSCERIPLYERETGVYLKINIRVNTQITTPGNTRAGEVKPEKMQVNFYDVETHALVSKFYVAPEGGFIDIGPGLYDVIIYNIDTEQTHVVNGNSSRGQVYAYTDFETTEMPANWRSANNNTTPDGAYIIREPDHLYVARMERVHIPERSTQDQTVELYAEASSLLETYTFRATNITNIKDANVIKAYITGQVRGRYLWDNHYPAEAVAITFNCQVNQASNEINTVFNTFGKFPNAVNTVYLHLFVGSSYDKGREYVFDVTNQFDDPDNTSHQIIVSEEINVPEAGSGNGGFLPNIKDWESENEDIDI